MKSCMYTHNNKKQQCISPLYRYQSPKTYTTPVIFLNIHVYTTFNKKTAYELYTYHILSHFIDFLNFFARMLFKVSILEFMSSTIRFRNSVNIPFCSENSVYAFQGTSRLYIYNFLEHFVDTTVKQLLTYA